MSAQCKWCGFTLDINHTDPCPKCGKVGKIREFEFFDTLQVKDSLSLTKLHEFYETNKTIRNTIIAITILSPVLGLLLSGVIGFLAGLLIGAISYFLSPSAITKVREIERWSMK